MIDIKKLKLAEYRVVIRRRSGTVKTERNSSIAELYKKGFTYKAIANKFNISKQRVQQIIVYLGIPKRSRSHSAVLRWDRYREINQPKEEKI